MTFLFEHLASGRVLNRWVCFRLSTNFLAHTLFVMFIAILISYTALKGALGFSLPRNDAVHAYMFVDIWLAFSSCFLSLLIFIQPHSCVFVSVYANHRNMEIRFYFLERDPYLFV